MTPSRAVFGYHERRPRRQHVTAAYLSVMLWFVGRAVVAVIRTDPEMKKEWAALPAGFIFRLGVTPGGPAMVVGKTPDGGARVINVVTPADAIDLDLRIKSLDAALRMFTFRESTAVSSSRNRLVIDGEVPPACAIVRLLDAVECYLLPGIIARLAVKRLPRWSLRRRTVVRCMVYLRTLVGA